MNSGQSFVLCVEDDRDTQEMLRVLLQESGCRFIAVDNCEEALRFIKENRLSLVLLDNVLTDGNGIDLCREVREFDKRVPVVFISGSAHDEERASALGVGANAFITKPFALNDLLGVLSQYIPLSQARP